MIDRLSDVQPSPTSRKLKEMSTVLIGSPPANGNTAILFALACSSKYRSAINFPSGETAAQDDDLSVTCSGLPPAMGTFQKVGFPCLKDLNKTHCPSGEQVGWESMSLPSVNCFGLLPLSSIFQRLKLPERFELKTTYRPSGETHPSPLV